MGTHSLVGEVEGQDGDSNGVSSRPQIIHRHLRSHKPPHLRVVRLSQHLRAIKDAQTCNNLDDVTASS